MENILIVSGPEQSLSALAERNMEHPLRFFRMSRASNGKALFTLRALTEILKRWPRQYPPIFVCLVLEMRVLMSTKSWIQVGQPRLAYWCRDRELLSLSEMVKQLTSAPARIVGLSDRGGQSQGRKLI